jgi:hypothetical protein
MYIYIYIYIYKYIHIYIYIYIYVFTFIVFTFIYTYLTVYICIYRNASKAAEGLCTWCRAMSDYHGASKIVKPKLEALRLAEAKLQVPSCQISITFAILYPFRYDLQNPSMCFTDIEK